MAQPGKFIVYPSQDQRNGGALGVSDGVKEACEALGWQFRLIDGQGTTNGQTSAIQQAIALKPDGIA
jgi:ribose transport system substrate-binding protein